MIAPVNRMIDDLTLLLDYCQWVSMKRQANNKMIAQCISISFC